MKLKRWKLFLWNFWPPFFFTGIKIQSLAQDFRHASTQLKLRWWNANYVGTQFGGSIFAMSDAMHMVMLINILGDEYVVWDKSATIRYLKPGRTTLTAEFQISDEDLRLIRENVEALGKYDWVKRVEIKDSDHNVIAEVDRTVHIRKRKPA
jgi:acyl-coenzyme A thioesterase PaaI-like protein